MSTQYQEARNGHITSQMRSAARAERTDSESVRREISLGRAVIAFNTNRPDRKATVAGRAFRTKVNANIGYSPARSCLADERRKLKTALDAGADFMMDLSVGPDLSATRRSLMLSCDVPFGTVPVYEAFARANSDVGRLTPSLLVDVIREQAEEGVDFMTIHAGLLRVYVPLAMKRIMGIVSRGGAILASWMTAHRKENPFFTAWDEILEVCAKHDVTVSIGDGLRPGCLADASDRAQFAELRTIGKLVKTCRKRGVQVIVEGPGHVPFNDIRRNMQIQQRWCDHAPFYVLGPLVTDIAPGYDHITSAIGATAAAFHGASLLCYVTPAEHLCLPNIEDVHNGVIAFRIAAHAADVARGLPGARDIDDAMAHARINFEWNKQFDLALDGGTARRRRGHMKSAHKPSSDYCTMCGREFCAMRASARLQKTT